MQTPLILFSLLALAACASEPTPKQIGAEGQTCEREYRVGSTIPVVTCSGPMTEAERQQILREVQNQMRTAPARPGSGGQ